MITVFAVTAGTGFAAAERHPHVGTLPGYPAIRGVIPALGSSSALSARKRLVDGAFAVARAKHVSGQRLFGPKATPAPNTLEAAPCTSVFEEELSFETQDVCYRGGPVAHDPRIHLIFWQGEPGTPGEEAVQPFPSGYETIVKTYFEDVAHDSKGESNVFAVQPQYGEEVVKGGEVTYLPGEYAIRPGVEVVADKDRFPSKCTDSSEFSPGPCVLDSDLQSEIAKYSAPNPKGLGDIYVVLTPPGVGGCLEAAGECAYRAYCAYHGDFGGDGVTPGQQTLYADLPYVGEVPECDFGVHPKTTTDNGADAVIDDASHEISETISDPIGSQCAAGAKHYGECELNAWTDAIGQEIGDKCLPPESTQAGIYGTALGEVVPGNPARAYNQLIDSHTYWTQREWSNEAGLSEGACVQRRIEASFWISAGRQATVPMTLDASSSGAPGDPAVYWVWNFGGGEQIGTASPTLSHGFATEGPKRVGLTAYDAYGNSQATEGEFAVGAAPTPPTPPGPPTPITIVLKESLQATHLTAAQVAAKLGLPTNGHRLTGSGPFALGHGQCPPACGVTIQLYARVTSTVNGRHVTELVSVGSAHKTLTAKGGSLSLALNAKGRSLLRKGTALACRLVVSVEDREGASWQILRSLRLTGARSARRARR
ncbi:MAG TPA: PKD domain-containing protein [Solirubrobacteraceae bacterium]|nr:PKD domain-containing protein [Solirubrobacteraceae bacterium]